MPFLCPSCQSPNLEIVRSIELAPDNRSDEITFQIIQCSDCHFSGLAVYQESRRGRLNSESYEHLGYKISNDKLAEVNKLVSQCPNLNKISCHCPAHQLFAQYDSSGYWQGLSQFDIECVFQMEFITGK